MGAALSAGAGANRSLGAFLREQRWAIALFFLTLLPIAVLLSIQPPDQDDFNFYHARIADGPLTTAWSLFRNWTGRPLGWLWSASLAANPFSLFKPAVLLSAAALLAWGFSLFARLPLLVRALAAGLLVLGFPFSGHVLTWESSACIYGLSSIFGVGALLLVGADGAALPQAPRLALALLLSLAAGLTCEAWIFIHGCVAAAWLGAGILKREPARIRWGASFAAAALLGTAIFLCGGNFRRMGIEGTATPVAAASLLECAIFALRKAGDDGRDFLPLLGVALGLLALAPLRDQPRLSLKGSWAMLLGGGAGILFFLFLLRYANVVSHWRIRCVFCAFGLFAVLHLPLEERFFSRLKIARRRVLAVSLLILGLAGLAANAWLTFGATEVSAARWLDWRAAALAVPTAPLPLPAWGSQDDRHRIHHVPDTESGRTALEFARERAGR